MRDINRVLFHVDKKTCEVSGGRSRHEECVFVMFDVFAVGAVG